MGAEGQFCRAVADHILLFQAGAGQVLFDTRFQRLLVGFAYHSSFLIPCSLIGARLARRGARMSKNIQPTGFRYSSLLTFISTNSLIYIGLKAGAGSVDNLQNV
ncbi:hypothetical protein [Pseudomonas congelans]|uniref:hypothetical protein n=1 Tax=Pseudomonas congelans TaxID=200452 RepID=UPI001F006F7D|nr:hypothetical protein [Pseudomonas congelans]